MKPNFFKNLGNVILNFDKILVIKWLFASLILSNAFRNFLRDQIIDPPKWWYYTIEEVANSPSNYPIYVATNSITYYSIKEKSKFDRIFKKLLERLTLIPLELMFSVDKEMEFYGGKCASFATSKIHDFHEILIPDEVVTEMRFDQNLDVRAIRKDFEFADKIIKL